MCKKEHTPKRKKNRYFVIVGISISCYGLRLLSCKFDGSLCTYTRALYTYFYSSFRTRVSFIFLLFFFFFFPPCRCPCSLFSFLSSFVYCNEVGNSYNAYICIRVWTMWEIFPQWTVSVPDCGCCTFNDEGRPHCHTPTTDHHFHTTMTLPPSSLLFPLHNPRKKSPGY